MEYTKIKKIDHVVLTSKHVEECLGFYRMLGFKAVEEDKRFALYAGDFKLNVHIEGQELKPNAYLAKPGTLDLCFEIEGSLDEMIHALDKQGIKTSEIGIKHGVLGEMHSFYVRDPDQNLLEFCSYE
ncbi:VOC family protein [Amedibacillus sp. YH-ame10]